MKKINTAYLFFYCAFLVVISVAIFFDKKVLIYTKPIVPIALIVLYVKSIKKIEFLFPICMIAVLVTDIFVYLDFIKYFDTIILLVSVYYLGCSFLLKKFISKDDARLHKLITLPVLISLIFIAYLIFSITSLAIPKLNSSIWIVALGIISALLFSAVNFMIYMVDRYEKSIYLFVTACCAICIDALLAINEMYYYTRVFTVVINSVEIIGLYFLVRFLIETKPRSVVPKDQNYF